MGQIEELEKYKNLLDSGAITEDEFRRMKQKILGLKTDEEKEAEKQEERNRVLAEIEQMREKERVHKEEERIRQEEERNQILREENSKREAVRLEEQAKNNQIQYQQTFDAEKAKEAARLEAAQEANEKVRQERNEKMQNAAKSTVSIVKAVILWGLTVFCLVFGIGSIGASVENGIKYILLGIDMLVLAILACPLITNKTREISQFYTYYKYKKIVVAVFVILAFVFTVL